MCCIKRKLGIQKEDAQQLKPDLTRFNDSQLLQVNSGAWQQLKDNLALAKTRRPQELGVDGALLPDAVALDKIRQKFLSMRKTYSPEKKVSLLLRVCKLIYSVMQDHSGGCVCGQNETNKYSCIGLIRC